MKRTLVLMLGALLLLQSCMAVPFVTSESIDKKLDNISLGSSKNEVRQKLGAPIYLIDIPLENHQIQAIGYDLGNYWYNESRLFVFKDDRLIAMPGNSYELLKILSTLRVIEGARFFDSNGQ